MKKLMPSEGLRLGCSSGSTRCVIAKNYVLGQPGGGTVGCIIRFSPPAITFLPIFFARVYIIIIFAM